MHNESPYLSPFLIKCDPRDNTRGMHVSSNPIDIVCIVMTRFNSLESTIKRYWLLVYDAGKYPRFGGSHGLGIQV